jgi:uncharacterized linocin/CFP29 family protein
MDHLLRGLAPITDTAWAQIDEEARRVLLHYLAARKLVDFTGPKGWTHASETTGRIHSLDPPPNAGVTAASREVQPLIELRAEFEVSRTELDAISRGAADPDLESVQDAARRIALAEDVAVFDGYAGGGILGITSGSPHEPIPIDTDYEQYPRSVAQAVAKLQFSGVQGPYGIALGPRCYLGLIETTKGGYPVFEHVRGILGGPLVWAPGVSGAVVVSMRGGDFEIVSGEDVSIGYLSHTADAVKLYLEETFTFRNVGPEAGIALLYND